MNAQTSDEEEAERFADSRPGMQYRTQFDDGDDAGASEIGRPEAVLAKASARARNRLEGERERKLLELQVAHVLSSFKELEAERRIVEEHGLRRRQPLVHAVKVLGHLVDQPLP